ncbi:hypothetical protein F0P96_09580 [Hymenobacter busanensis]|uniref:Uncharacterized protein n=1 Tax=Hymenobacter busanensis TaxID=2607656 RepID=A0A7L4ZZ98_9BACT|nr:hypothetical protein [Hymenobacter busanensis]KAA9333218.1 hypothetical protein F0P96_09580 [Hymenobacter busanensis]QHJ08105.1 hypothetical protein GUY19_12740 [Hymenobacter busanensis]
MVPFLAFVSLRRWLSYGLLVLVLAGPGLSSCRLFHPYRLPNPTGPAMPKQKKKKAASADQSAADGSDMSTAKEPAKVQKNGYDKNGLLKKPKYERRRLKKKIGQRRFLGIPLPW